MQSVFCVIFFNAIGCVIKCNYIDLGKLMVENILAKGGYFAHIGLVAKL